MAWGFVQGADDTASGAGTTVVEPFVSDVTVGNVLIAGCTWTGDSITVVITDSLGNTWTALASSLATNGNINRRTQLFYAPVTNGGTCTVTMTVSTGGFDRGLAITEYSGLDLADLVETSSNGNNTTANASVALTTANDNALLISVGLFFAANTPGSGFTERTADPKTEDMNQAVAGVTAVTWTNGATNWAVSGAAFNESTGGGDPPQEIRPDADVTTTGWTTTALFSKINDESDASVITATAS